MGLLARKIDILDGICPGNGLYYGKLFVSLSLSDRIPNRRKQMATYKEQIRELFDNIREALGIDESDKG